MKKQEKSKDAGQKSNSMNAMDQGINLIAQTVNNATGIDKDNDGKINKNELHTRKND
ncbi:MULTISPECIES: hypothetical protein [Bacillaceae]|uniref:hypothetical protein n=1 Tax=Bacillaceae TaxID=186817 RepID=UPI000360699E|nr:MULTISPECIES: hypothetical protein [Bacillaceae]